MADSPPTPVTQLLLAWNQGSAEARERLIAAVYDDLRRLAARSLRRERRDHTLQPTALVHETYLRLIGQSHVTWQNRAHFFGVAAQLMRRVLVDHARTRLARKRGGTMCRLPLDEAVVAAEATDVDILALHEALEELASLDATQEKIVELRYFGGLSIEETGEVLDLSPATVKRDFRLARAWLHRQLTRS